MAKRKKKSQNKSSKLLIYIAWSLASIALLLSVLLAGYYFGYENAQTDVIEQEQVKKDKRLELLKELKKSEKDKEKIVLKEEKKDNEEEVKKRLKEVIKTVPKDLVSATHEYEVTEIPKPPKAIKRKISITTGKPKLAIIIDDVCVRKQVKAIKNLQLPLTMSFLPPSSSRPNSAKLASKESFYMVHLPMEAMSFTAEEPTTLYIQDSQKKIAKRIDKIRKLFPKVKYINNHTGSKFTSNEVAMNRLINVLNSHNINFIDSRTTAKTKVPKVMKNYGLKYISRDVFLDHRMDKAYVKKQIKEAIRIAKKHGTAVAIGHPHKNTLLALKESKKLFDGIELVYINKL
ncbi:MAG: divergent polysaccharide deacetylase family protein [Campylobacterota bacterium]|nr:divergent polysaccharide deacetylase family protein [Campylobacterota bacterium]